MKIACVGDNCIDYYDDSGLAFPGGNPVNVAVYLRRLGAASAYLGAVGTDAYGDLLLRRLAEKGVDTSHVQCLDGHTALCHVTHADGDRVLGDYDEGVMASFALRQEDFEYLKDFDLLVTGLWGHTENSLETVHGMGVPVAFDGADRPLDPAGLIALRHTDIAFFSDDQSDRPELEEKILEVAGLGPKIVAATRGAKGSLAYDGSRFVACPAKECDPVDTMGAGDSFIAGFLCAWLRKMPLLQCMERGSENAAVTIAYKGAW
ncbi:MAG: fructoselysine 6-kinase [Oscillospiraceae bacterium]|nr:fructoselysine 6-kinase [Oscillospiraceae bacterium]